MENKDALFSVLSKRNGKVLLRETTSRTEAWFDEKEFNMAFEQSGSPYLVKYSEKGLQLAEEAGKANEEIAKTIPLFLIARKNMTTYNVLVFGTAVNDIMEKYGFSFSDFHYIFNQIFYSMFGQYPSFDGVLELKGLDK